MLSDVPDQVLERLRAICLSFADAGETVSHGVPAFKTVGRMFLYFRHDHHGDGRTVACVKTTGREEQEMLIEADPDLYSWPAYLGNAGWIAVSLAGPDTDWAHVEGRACASHALATRKTSRR